jgi:hypothetical protein
LVPAAGCGGRRRTRWTQAHHLREWDAHHGLTDYENLATLCRRHHRLVHEGGWKMSGDPCAELVFTSPTGSVLASWPDDNRRPPGDPPDPPPPAVAGDDADRSGRRRDGHGARLFEAAGR